MINKKFDKERKFDKLISGVMFGFGFIVNIFITIPLLRTDNLAPDTTFQLLTFMVLGLLFMALSLFSINQGKIRDEIYELKLLMENN